MSGIQSVARWAGVIAVVGVVGSVVAVVAAIDGTIARFTG